MAANFQNKHPNPCKYSKDGFFGSKFVTVIVTGKPYITWFVVYFFLAIDKAGLKIFFQDWWAEATHGAENGGSFSEMIGPSISN